MAQPPIRHAFHRKMSPPPDRRAGPSFSQDRPSPLAAEFDPSRRWNSIQPGADMYANPSLRESARAEIAALLGRAHPALAIPEYVGTYYAIVPLEAQPTPIFGRAGPHGLLYKGVSASRGSIAALLRIIGAPPAPSAQIVRAGEAWKRVRHPALLCLKEVFTTRQFTARSTASMVPTNEVVFVYEFSSRAETLFHVFLNPTTPDHRYHPLPEATLWAIASQILSAVAVVHSNRLALRDALTINRVLVTGRNRVRINCVGLSDAFDPSGGDHLPATSPRATTTNDRVSALQKGDLSSVGHILAVLALRIDPKFVRSGSLLVPEDVAVEAMRRLTPYSEDLTVLVMSLLSAAVPTSQVTTNQILGMIGPRLALELGNVWTHTDSLENMLFVEFDSSRMFRLMGLLGFVNERSDAGVEHQWSETGDRYLLKLFRDYVFHRVDENGKPILDMAHVVECLSRLDIGSPEQVLLSSRDGSSLIVATYEDLRRCLLQSMDELRSAGHGLPNR
ncbi:PAB-dependent poly(A)-specific ribonuclease subunit PAN3 [Gracilariopsis chorda]|uniref:PAB-dependent poly(A)-specific ribonuclease subunit PAN3 n=1 Tax=Gracilariopsis chorda TaxID=448386 RepID=A0A2V3IVK2_9FLOR|nr:PAB-dependent poly(A)-specific ribonuclease subunit PAN3 [Gracilariopsis chorda]|eukprot:PXF46119.1 PAB-dependent poly(A)-specific ribonuclease subunit PAN3 [Gracilariopsis chorda]